MVVRWSVGLLPFLSFTSIQAQDNAVSKLQNLINKIEIKMPLIYGDSTVYAYNFLSSGCLSSISEVSTSKSEKMDHIITFAFNLGQFKDAQIMVDKPTDSEYEPIEEDLWTMEVGVVDVLIQNTDWRQKQTLSNHFTIYVFGKEETVKIAGSVKKAIIACGGTFDKIIFLVK